MQVAMAFKSALTVMGIMLLIRIIRITDMVTIDIVHQDMPVIVAQLYLTVITTNHIMATTINRIIGPMVKDITTPGVITNHTDTLPIMTDIVISAAGMVEIN
jgi:hypothetical protein